MRDHPVVPSPQILVVLVVEKISLLEPPRLETALRPRLLWIRTLIEKLKPVDQRLQPLATAELILRWGCPKTGQWQHPQTIICFRRETSHIMALTIAVCSNHTEYTSCAVYILEMYKKHQKTAYLPTSVIRLHRLPWDMVGMNAYECINQRGRGRDHMH